MLALLSGLENLTNHINFDDVIEGTKKTLWETFQLVAEKFTQNHELRNYWQISVPPSNGIQCDAVIMPCSVSREFSFNAPW